MSLKYANGQYRLKNKGKYIGLGLPRYRSSWEFIIMKMCDENPAILEWASESIKIPYRDPLTGRNTIYVPDFLVVYADKNQKRHVELWEIKPEKQTSAAGAGKNVYDQAQYVRNIAKWEVARNWCKKNGVIFRIITEHDIFHMGGKRK